MPVDGEAPIDADLRNAEALVFVEDLDTPVVADEDVHHLIDVLRLRVGATVALGNGAGCWRLAEILELPNSIRRRPRAAGDSATPLVLASFGEITKSQKPSPELSVAFAIPKGDRFELIVQKLTELGIDHIFPLVTKRTVVRVDPMNITHRKERITRIAKEAASQSRRLFLPVVHGPRPLDAFLMTNPNECAIAEPGGAPLSETTRCVLVGPEGGWEEGELPKTMARVGFGPTILRAETAAITAGVLLAAIRAGTIAHG